MTDEQANEIEHTAVETLRSLANLGGGGAPANAGIRLDAAKELLYAVHCHRAQKDSQF